MTFVVLAALAIVWVVVLGSYARERMADRRTDSVSAFHSQLSTLQRTNGHAGSFDRRRGASSVAAGSASSMHAAMARQRRKNVLVGLLSLAVGAVVFAAVVGGVVAVLLAVGSVGAFTAYVTMLVNRQRVITEQQAKVRPLRSVPTSYVARSTTRSVASSVASRR